MVNLSPTMLAAIALVSGAWLVLAVGATLRGLGRSREAEERIDSTRHHEALLAASPAIPLVVHRDRRLEEAERLATALGLAELPDRLSGFGAAFDADDMERLEAQ